MSGSEHARPARCIWPSRELLAELERSISFDGDAKAIARQLLAMHDAAPADPTEAVEQAVDANLWVGRGSEITKIRDAVLRALGCAKDPA